MRRFLLQGFLTALALLLAAPWAESSFFQHTKAYEHQDLKAGKINVHSVRILPPQVEFKKAGVKSSKELTDKELELEKKLPIILATVLKQHGCSVLKSMFTETTLASDTNLKYALADLQKQFDTLDAKIERKPRDVQKGRYTMGYVINKLNPGGTTDALVFVRGTGLLKTNSRAFLTAFGGVKMAFYAEIAVVDARTGNVLYYVRLTDQRPDLVVKKPERLTKPITNAFKKFPGTATGK